MEDESTRLFFVVDSVIDNEEIFETLQEAREFKKSLDPENEPRIYIALVENAYIEPDTKGDKRYWNYEDHSNTFELIKEIQ